MLSEQLKIKNLGQVTRFLGWQIERKDDYFEVHQTDYIDALFEEYQMTEAATLKYPMNEFELHDKEQEVKVELPVREMVGSLLYLAYKSRPDVSATIQFLSRQVNRPTDALIRTPRGDCPHDTLRQTHVYMLQNVSVRVIRSNSSVQLREETR